MLDRFDRNIRYLRVSVTDRCNLACDYCTEGAPARHAAKDDILSFEEIAETVRIGAGLGIDKVRLTGGEPLMRKDLSILVSMIARIKSITDLSLTTNGTLLREHALSLKEAGIARINVSLDTIDREEYERITGFDMLPRVIEGIEAARHAGFSPIKLNCVIDASPEDPRPAGVLSFAKENGYDVRFIKRMNLKEGVFGAVRGGEGGKCSLCDRLRLTCDGRILPCLFDDKAFSIRELGIEEAFRKAVREKPASGKKSSSHTIQSVGG
jgi:GTP 3',8-cyclase